MNNANLLTIDLLKGHGRPVRSDPDKIALMAIALTVPAVIVIGLLGLYFRNNVIVSVQTQRIVNCENSINKMSEAQTVLAAYEKQKTYTDNCLSEVSKNLKKQMQWTPAIVQIVNIMPDSILLAGMDIKSVMMKKKVPSKKAVGGMVEMSVPVTTMRINLYEKSGVDNGRSIRLFQDALRASSVFNSRIDSITVSQSMDSLDGRDIILYQVDCCFKPQL